MIHNLHHFKINDINGKIIIIIIMFYCQKTVKTAFDSHGGSILLYFNLRRRTSEGPYWHKPLVGFIPGGGILIQLQIIVI